MPLLRLHLETPPSTPIGVIIVEEVAPQKSFNKIGAIKNNQNRQTRTIHELIGP